MGLKKALVKEDILLKALLTCSRVIPQPSWVVHIKQVSVLFDSSLKLRESEQTLTLCNRKLVYDFYFVLLKEVY